MWHPPVPGHRHRDARALLTSGSQGSCDFIDADLRDTAAIVAQAGSVLDFTQPAAPPPEPVDMYAAVARTPGSRV